MVLALMVQYSTKEGEGGQRAKIHHLANAYQVLITFTFVIQTIQQSHEVKR